MTRMMRPPVQNPQPDGIAVVTTSNYLVPPLAACRGRWAVITREGPADTSFQAHFVGAHWRWYAGYPVGTADAPRRGCVQHP